MNTNELFALKIICDRDELPSRVAAKLGIKAASMTCIADRLEKQGLIIRRRSKTDRRATYLTATERGLRHLNMTISNLSA